MPVLRSRTSTHGRNMAGARGLWRATGMTDGDFGKPIIAIVNSFTQFVPGHVHLKDLGQMVAREVEKAGGVAKEFNTIAVDDGIAMGHDGMLYSLPSREIIADSVEYMVNAHCADAMVCISNCDKITPGMLMAALRLNIPVVFVSGGPMEAGKVIWEGEEKSLDLVDAMIAAADDNYSDEQVEAIERSACPTCGSCSGMFTANSMNCLTEALGLSLPGNGSLLATHADRKELFLKAGRLVVELCERFYQQDDYSVLPRNIASFEAFENAMTLDIAMGGSTNTVLHLLAAAHEGKIDFTMADIDRLSRNVPCLCKVAPAKSDVHMEDVHRAGGIMALLGELDRAGLIHRDVHSVHAKTLGDAIDKWDIAISDDEDVAHFGQALQITDPLVAQALEGEKQRQNDQIELIASENIVSRAVLEALGHEMTNKTLEGYPGNRFHSGGEYVDIVEQAAIDRAQELFGCAYANVQPHSGSQANLAVFFLLLAPGDKILSLDLASGGHLSHGLSANLSGRWFEPHHYGVDPKTATINYDALEEQALKIKPKLIITGGSAYPRAIDFERMGRIAKKVGAHFHVDMAHIAGLVAAGVHASPFPHADIVTCTTTKTLRGPRGGLILTNNESWFKKLQSSVFPGVQGSIHSQIIAAKAVCLAEALTNDFKAYGAQIIANAAKLAEILQTRGIDIVSGGTDTHLVLLDLRQKGITGKTAETALKQANITTNKNPIPNDSPRPPEWVGLRLGVAAATTRGLKEPEFEQLAHIIADLIEGAASGASAVEENKALVAKLCAQFPVINDALL